jgi:nucleoside-diphosphate-sugar epimerase
VPEHAKALVLGLGDRKKETPQGPTPYIIHQSGTSNLSDRPHSNPGRKQPHEHTDTNSKDIYDFEKTLEAGEPYTQRTAELAIIDTADAVGVKSVVIMSPTIYGIGSGPGNKSSIQIPTLIRAVRKNGYAAVAGDGGQEWDHVSMDDLAALYELVAARIVSGVPVQTNKDGILFSETGRRSWRELAQAVIDAGVKLGALPKDTPIKEVSMQEAADSYGLGAAALFVELGFLSNSRTKSDAARELGWEPKDGPDDYKKGVEQDWVEVLKGDAK